MPEGLVSTELDDERMPGIALLAHLEQLRSCVFRCLGGLGVAFVVSLTFTDRLWLIVSNPAIQALTQLGVKDPRLIMRSPMDGFSIVWIKLPLLVAIFMASPWIVYQIWRFATPALPKKFRSMAGPFVLATAGLFIVGGLFAYFVVFRFGLTFLLSIGVGDDITQRISIVDYFDLFVNVILGVGLVFEMPVVIFCLTLLRIASPAFLIDHSRYAILIIVIIAAIVTAIAVIAALARRILGLIKTRDPLSENVHLTKIGAMGGVLAGVAAGSLARFARGSFAARNAKDA